MLGRVGLGAEVVQVLRQAAAEEELPQPVDEDAEGARASAYGAISTA